MLFEYGLSNLVEFFHHILVFFPGDMIGMDIREKGRDLPSISVAFSIHGCCSSSLSAYQVVMTRRLRTARRFAFGRFFCFNSSSAFVENSVSLESLFNQRYAALCVMSYSEGCRGGHHRLLTFSPFLRVAQREAH
jgi:hypothetical protein